MSRDKTRTDGTLSDGTITLRPPTEDDAEVMAALIRASYEHLRPWMVWAKPDHSAEDVLPWIRRTGDETAHNFIVLDPEGAPVGSAGVNRVDSQNSHADVGYWISHEAVGNGYATRATNLLLRYAIEQVGLNRVEIWMSTENEPSRAVAEHSMATYEATLRQCLMLEDRAHDAHCYTLLAEELPNHPT